MSHPTSEKETFEPHAKPGSRRIGFCPTCHRPFVHGTGFFQKSCLDRMHPARKPADSPECPEYCSENCVPGLPA